MNSLDEMLAFGKYVADSPFAPKGMNNPGAICVAIQMGLEVGLPPMAALQNIAVINGRPGLFGDAALALVRASGLLEYYKEEIGGEGEKLGAKVTLKRKGFDKAVQYFTVGDARLAGLLDKPGPWKQYPKRMLKFRARGFLLRDQFGDILKGFKTVEELRDYDDAIDIETENNTTSRPDEPIDPFPKKESESALDEEQETLI